MTTATLPRPARRRVPVPLAGSAVPDVAAAARTGPPVGLSSGPLGELQAADRAIGRLTAARFRAAAAFARTRPSSVDRPAGAPGAMSARSRAARPAVLAAVSEWAAQELTVALSLGHGAAQRLLEESLLLVDRLPATLVALEAGTVHVGHLPTFLGQVAPIADDEVRGQVEADLLSWAAGRVNSPAQLAERARRVVLELDATAAARRLAQAIRSRGVYLSPGRDAGTEQLTAVLTTPEARACWRVLGAYVDALDDDDPADGRPVRTRAQRMADVLLDLVLRPASGGQPVVQAQLTLVATVETMAGGDAPGEVDGQVVPAEVVRHLARSLGLVPDLAAEAPSTTATVTATDPSTAPEPPTAAAPADAPRPASPGATASEPPSPAATAPEPPSPRATAPEPPSPRATAPELSSPGATAPEARGDTTGCGHDDERLQTARAWSRGPAATAEERRLLAAVQAEEARPVEEQRWPVREQLPPDMRGAELPDLDDHDGWRVLWEYWRARELAGATATSDARSGAGGATPGPPVGWAEADLAVQRASEQVRAAERAVACAARDVSRAELRALAEEQRHAGSVAGLLTRARTTATALAAVADDHRAALTDLLLRTGGGGLADRPRIAVVDALSGTLLALTDARHLRRIAHCARDACARRARPCDHDLRTRPALAAPPPTAGYRPGAQLDRFVRTRDQRCRFPACRARVPGGGELDHDRPYPDGPTSAGNLVGFCVRHHRGKHQAPGWLHELRPDGSLTVTTPTGLTTTTLPAALVEVTAARSEGATATGPPAAAVDPPPF